MKKDLNYIFLRSLKERRKNYSLVLISGIFLIAIVYITTAIGDYMSQAITGEYTDGIRNYITISSFLPTYVLLFIFMFLVLIIYIRKRIEDYELLNILGIKRRHRRQFIMREVGGIVIVSASGGILAGFAGAMILKYVLIEVFPEIKVLKHGIISLETALCIGGLLFLMLFIGCHEMVEIFGIDVFLSFGRKERKGINSSPMRILIGILLIMTALLSMNTYFGKVSKIYPIVIADIGLFMLILSIGSIYLRKLKEDEERYFKKVWWLNGWNSKSFYHFSMTFAVAVILFQAIFCFSTLIWDNIPARQESNYPYDLVWMANQEDEVFLKELKEKYHVQMKTQPCIRVTSADQGEHIAVSVKDYEKWTGRRVSVKDGEVYIVYQRDRAFRNYIGIDSGSNIPRIYIGPARYDLWVYVLRPVPGYRFEQSRFDLAGEEDRVLTGIFKGAIGEHIVVFSDNYYQTIKKTAEGANLVAMINIPEHYNEVVTEIYQYARENSEIDYFSNKGDNLIYEKRKLILEYERNRLFYIASGIINMLVLVLCSIFILTVKMECDVSDMEKKYYFYYIAGATRKKRRDGIKKELSLSCVIASFVGVMMAAIFVAVELYLKHMGSEWTKRYFLEYTGIAVGIVFILMVLNTIWIGKAIRKLEVSCDESERNHT